MEISKDAMRQVEKALEEYEDEVESADLKLATKHTYILHAKNFVKWLRGDFVPGSQGRRN